MVILSLGISLIGYWYLGGLLRARIAYAEQNAARWRDEFTENDGKATAWPSTERIDSLARRFRFLRTFLPVIGLQSRSFRPFESIAEMQPRYPKSGDC